jgi:hypothetical protein
MLDNYLGATPPGTFTVVEYHVGDSYSTTWGNARDSFYGITGTPTAIFDGVQSVVGAGSVDSAYTNYMAKYNLRQGVATDVTIQLGGRLISGNTYEIRAKVGIDTGGTGKTLRVYLTQVLDHYPASPSYERYTFIQAATTHGAEDLVTVTPGQFQVVSRNFTLSGASLADLNNVKIVAWTQDTSAGNKNIWQAATMGWPFVPLQIKGDMNGDGYLDTNDIAPFSLALVNLPAWQLQYPEINLLEAGDMNDDGIFNSTDIQPLVPILINDQTPPTPSPMTWVSFPASISTTEISMTSTTATDISGVEYYFFGQGLGYHHSGWISVPTYTDSALRVNQTYSYKVQARDLSPQQNTTLWSTVKYATTFIETPAGLTVDSTTSNSIQLTALGTFTALNQNLSGLYFEVTDMAGTPAGTGAGINSWTSLTTSKTATATGLTPGTTYRIRVKARNRTAENETPWFPAADYIYGTTAP